MLPRLLLRLHSTPVGTAREQVNRRASRRCPSSPLSRNRPRQRAGHFGRPAGTAKTVLKQSVNAAVPLSHPYTHRKMGQRKQSRSRALSWRGAWCPEVAKADGNDILVAGVAPQYPNVAGELVHDRDGPLRDGGVVERGVAGHERGDQLRLLRGKQLAPEDELHALPFRKDRQRPMRLGGDEIDRAVAQRRIGLVGRRQQRSEERRVGKEE